MIGEYEILKYLEGGLSAKKAAELEAWLKASRTNKTHFKKFKNLWEQSGKISSFKMFDTEQAWSSFEDALIKPVAVEEQAPEVNQEIKKEEVPLEEMVQEPLEQVHLVTEPIKEASVIELDTEKIRATIEPENNRLKKLRRFTDWSVAASILFLAVAAFNFWPKNNSYEIVATEDQTIELADGTIVDLKKDAHLITLKDFSKAKQRNITLTGNATFDVSENKKPFVIHAGAAGVKVLGTKFSLLATVGASEIENHEGLVRFYDLKDESNFIDVNPGQKFQFDGSDFENISETGQVPVEETGYKLYDVLDYMATTFPGKIVVSETLKYEESDLLELPLINTLDFDEILAYIKEAGINFTTDNGVVNVK